MRTGSAEMRARADARAGTARARVLARRVQGAILSRNGSERNMGGACERLHDKSTTDARRRWNKRRQRIEAERNNRNARKNGRMAVLVAGSCACSRSNCSRLARSELRESCNCSRRDATRACETRRSEGIGQGKVRMVVQAKGVFGRRFEVRPGARRGVRGQQGEAKGKGVNVDGSSA
eukprot:1053750-Pleurochrysis_carterae.AAC.3